MPESTISPSQRLWIWLQLELSKLNSKNAQTAHTGISYKLWARVIRYVVKTTINLGAHLCMYCPNGYKNALTCFEEIHIIFASEPSRTRKCNKFCALVSIILQCRVKKYCSILFLSISIVTVPAFINKVKPKLHVRCVLRIGKKMFPDLTLF